jgi:hypothetical protein
MARLTAWRLPGRHRMRRGAEGLAGQQAGHGDVLAGKQARDQVARVSGGARVVQDRHISRVRLQPVPTLLADSGDMVTVEPLRDYAGLLTAVGPHHEVVPRPDDLIRAGQHQVTGHAAGFLSRLPPCRRGDRFAELHLAARQQPPPRVRAALLPDERHRAARSRHHDERGRHHPPRSLCHPFPLQSSSPPGARPAGTAPSLDPPASPALAEIAPARRPHAHGGNRERQAAHSALRARHEPFPDAATSAHVLPGQGEGIQGGANTVIIPTRLIPVAAPGPVGELSLQPAFLLRPGGGAGWLPYTLMSYDGDALLYIRLPGPAVRGALGSDDDRARWAVDLSARHRAHGQQLNNHYCWFRNLLPGLEVERKFTLSPGTDIWGLAATTHQRVRVGVIGGARDQVLRREEITRDPA